MISSDFHWMDIVLACYNPKCRSFSQNNYQRDCVCYGFRWSDVANIFNVCRFMYYILYTYIWLHPLHIHILVDVCFTHIPHIYVCIYIDLIVLCMKIWSLKTITIWWPAFEPISCIILSKKKNSSTYPLMYSKLIRIWCAVNFSFWNLWLSAFMIRFLERSTLPQRTNGFPVFCSGVVS